MVRRCLEAMLGNFSNSGGQPLAAALGFIQVACLTGRSSFAALFYRLQVHLRIAQLLVSSYIDFTLGYERGNEKRVLFTCSTRTIRREKND
jgi:hypothetical protein